MRCRQKSQRHHDCDVRGRGRRCAAFRVASPAMSLPRWIALAGCVALAFGSAPAHADLLPENMTYVPVKLTLDGPETLAEASVCMQHSSKAGGHSFARAKPGGALECRTVERPLDVRAVPERELKPLEDLYAQNKG